MSRESWLRVLRRRLAPPPPPLLPPCTNSSLRATAATPESTPAISRRRRRWVRRRAVERAGGVHGAGEGVAVGVGEPQLRAPVLHAVLAELHERGGCGTSSSMATARRETCTSQRAISAFPSSPTRGLKQRMNYEGLATHQVATRREVSAQPRRTWATSTVARRSPWPCAGFSRTSSYSTSPQPHPVRARGAGKPIDAMPKAFAAYGTRRPSADHVGLPPRPARCKVTTCHRQSDTPLRRGHCRTLSPPRFDGQQALQRFDAMPSDGWHR